VIETVLFLAAWALILIGSLMLLKMSDSSLLQPNIISIVYIYFISFNYLGFPLLYFFKISHLFNIGVDDRDIILSIFLLSSGSLLCLLGGTVYAKFIFKLGHRKPAIPECNVNTNLTIETFIVLGLISIIFLIFYKSGATIPIQALIEADFTGHNVARSSLHGFAGKLWRFNIFFYEILPFVTYFIFANWLFNKSALNLLTFFLVLMFSCFLAVMNLQKGPLIHFLIGLILVFLLKKQKPISIKGVFLTLFIGILLMASSYVIFMGRAIEQRVLIAPFKRILAAQIAPAYFYYEIFPRHHEFLYGRSLPNPAGIFPFKNYALAKNVQDYIKPHLREKGIHGSAPAAYWAGLYANFGYWFVFIFSFLLGLIFYVTNWLFSRSRFIPINLALMAWIAIHFAKISLTSIGYLLIDVKLVSVLLCYSFIRYGPALRSIIRSKYHKVSPDSRS
jgi:oligosaccharide repeat unit polymerase